jgi:transcriptional regulator with XRE-family HTH domain
MTRPTTVNGPLIRSLRLDANYTASDLGAIVGLRPEVIRRLERSDPKTLTVMTGQQLIDLANALGTEVDTLLRPDHTPAPAAPDDAIALLSLLHGQQRDLKPTALAESLGWDLSRLTDAQLALNARLEPLGQTVRKSPTGLRLTLLHNPVIRASRRRLLVKQAEIRGLDLPTARVLYEVVYGQRSTASGHPPSAKRLQRLAFLEGLGAIDSADHSPVASADLRYALDLP